MKKLLSAFCLLSLASTLTFAQDNQFWRQSPNQRNSPRHHQNLQQRNYVCNAEWKPVCARTRQNIVARYSNSCYAEQDGAIVIGPPEECELISCPAIYEPVCARIIIDTKNNDELIDRERARTMNPASLIYLNKAYFNECAAREIGRGTPLISYSEGRHRYSEHKYYKGVVDINSVCPTTCSGKIDLVCARDDHGKERLYANRCSAVLEGAVFIRSGVCAGSARR
jgi:hypothetical protein